MATGHLVCGATGAGKTTYALALAQELGAIRFTIDEWMASLFWPDAPAERVYPWALERTERCERQILALCAQLFARGQDAVLDLGFFTRVQRKRVAAGVRSAGGEPRLHYLPLSADARWERVVRRNERGGPTPAIPVTREMFDFCEGLFEVPAAAELAGGVIAPEPAA